MSTGREGSSGDDSGTCSGPVHGLLIRRIFKTCSLLNMMHFFLRCAMFRRKLTALLIYTFGFSWSRIRLEETKTNDHLMNKFAES